jgi:hypothetical protein
MHNTTADHGNGHFQFGHGIIQVEGHFYTYTPGIRQFLSYDHTIYARI